MTQPKHRPERQSLVIHVGAAFEPATLPEWWGAIDSDVESRGLRFAGSDGNWLADDELPTTLHEAGGRLADIAETEGRDGLADPSLAPGQAVILRPEPHPTDRYAIAVWSTAPQHIGFLLGDIAAETMSESHRRQAAYKAIVAGEVRDKESGARRSVTILLGPAAVWADTESE